MNAAVGKKKNYSALFVYLSLLLISLFVHYKFTSVLSKPGFHAATQWVASIESLRGHILRYLSLQEVNNRLVQENLHLHKKLHQAQQQSTSNQPYINAYDLNTYDVIHARILRHTFEKRNNFITLNQGATAGVRPGMGLITQAGIVGEIKQVSESFSTAYSVLHTDWLIAAMLKKDGTLCSVHWQYPTLSHASVQYLPRHVQVQVNDTVFTSGYDNVFQAGIPIGIVDAVDITPNASFYSVQIKWAVDFTQLHDAYIIDVPGQVARDSLEQLLEP